MHQNGTHLEKIFLPWDPTFLNALSNSTVIKQPATSEVCRKGRDPGGFVLPRSIIRIKLAETLRLWAKICRVFSADHLPAERSS